MTQAQDLPLPDEVALLRQSWWLHDARWYQAVKTRFGQEAANELNAEVMQFVASRLSNEELRSLPAAIEKLSPPPFDSRRYSLAIFTPLVSKRVAAPLGGS